MRFNRLGSNQLGGTIGTRDDEAIVAIEGTMAVAIDAPGSVTNGTPFVFHLDVTSSDGETNGTFFLELTITGSATTLNISVTDADGWANTSFTGDASYKSATFNKTSGFNLNDISITVTPTGTGSVGIFTSMVSSDQTETSSDDGVFVTINPG